MNMDRTRLRYQDLFARLESCYGVEPSGRLGGEGIRAAVYCGGRLGRTGKAHFQCTRPLARTTARSPSLGLLLRSIPFPQLPYPHWLHDLLRGEGRDEVSAIASTLLFHIPLFQSFLQQLGISLITHFHAPRPYIVRTRLRG